LLLVDRDADGLAALDLAGKVERIAGDVSDPALWERVEAAVPSIDRAVINAGVATAGTVEETSLEDWRRTMSVNLDGAFLSLRTAMRKAGEGASIVVTASASGLKPQAGAAAYAASKAGLIQLAKVAALEGASRGIRVNAIAPGGVDTPIWDGVSFFQDFVANKGGDREAAMAEMAQMATPLGRFASAEEIAAQILFLLSEDAATITGTVLVSDGGYSA
jgi:NAD(P)-dependent dehydrogenase (short-subunit alcohol dehydrogenase family)